MSNELPTTDVSPPTAHAAPNPNLTSSFVTKPHAAPPFNLDAEQSTLGAMLMQQTIIGDVVEVLQPIDFYNALTRRIYMAILAVDASGSAVDIVTVAEYLRRKDQLEDSGGLAYLAALIESCPSSANWQSYADIVRELSQKRAAALLSIQATNYAMNGVNSEVALDELRSAMDALEARKPSKRQTSFNAQTLLGLELPEADWVVPNLLPMGFTILAGNPKLGKSWMALNVGIAVATGGAVFGEIQVDAGDVLYLALEDTAKRMQRRLRQILGAWPIAPDLSRLQIELEWPRLDIGGVARIERWLNDHGSSARIIIIDTFQKVRGVGGKATASAYGADYEAVEGLKLLADRYNVAIIIVHHRKKGEGMDDLESISGSYGLTGAADSIWSLKRERGRSDATMFVTGRDVEEREMALEWKAAIGAWVLLGEAGEYRLSQERGEIVAALRDAKRPLTPKEVHDLGIGKTYPNVKQLLWKMSRDGQLRGCDGGRYALPANTITPGETAPGVPLELELNETEQTTPDAGHAMFN